MSSHVTLNPSRDDRYIGQRRFYRIIHCLTSEFHFKFHAKSRYRTNRFAMSAISVFQVKFKGRFTRYDFCPMRQWLTTGPRHDLRLLCTSGKCRSILKHVLKRYDNRKSCLRPVVSLSHATKIAPCKSAQRMPTIVIAHTLCPSRDTRISYRQCLLIQGYFCALQNYAEKAEFSKCSWYPKRKLGVTTHFSEIIKLEFWKRTPYIALYFKAFYKNC